MIDLSAGERASDGARPLCWICNRNEANSGEHKTKRSDLLAVLGEPTQKEPFYLHDLERPNRPVKSLDAKLLKAAIRICAECNSARTQPHDRAWERMSDRLRARLFRVGLRACARHHSSCATLRLRFNLPQPGVSIIRAATQFRVGQWVRANKIFPYDTRREMTNVHLFFLKLFGCMLCEAKANEGIAPLNVEIGEAALPALSR
jgi:hypothetical protein